MPTEATLAEVMQVVVPSSFYDGNDTLVYWRCLRCQEQSPEMQIERPGGRAKTYMESEAQTHNDEKHRMCVCGHKFWAHREEHCTECCKHVNSQNRGNCEHKYEAAKQ